MPEDSYEVVPLKANRCDKCRRFCAYRLHPIDGLSLERNWKSIFCWYIRCPPHSFIGWATTRVILCGLAFILVYYFCETEVDPNYEYSREVKMTIICMFLVYASARLLAFFMRSAQLPELLGMLLAGFVLSNSYPDVQNINKTTKSIMSDLAFSIILVRAGLSLNIETFKQMKATIFLLAMTPGCVVEATIVAMLAWIVLDFTISWAYMFGFIICAISPAIIVPTMLKIQTEGYDNGLVALIITAGSLDDISALFAFSLARVPAFEKEGVGWFILTALIWTVCSVSVALC
ncbi:sodium/hydrogen exchanger 9B2-like [Convolutriloba macropyga]|uniref:sodium/hydrogen exchanger 9B2-like n=1 Tax=Convolutriloba macropyga TaxID=536237 RepID=UPI003F520157